MLSEDNKKILFVNRRLSVGGSERVMTILANGMAEYGINVDMVVLQNDMPQTYDVDSKVNVIKFEHEKYSPAFKAIKRLCELRKIIKAGKYDAVISFMHIVNFYTIIAGFGTKNIIVSERADPRRETTFIKQLGRSILYPFAAKIVFQTEEARSCFPKTIQKKGYIIPNPINNNLPKPYEGERSKEIVAVGRFTEQKNFKLTIDAFKMLHNNYPEYKLTIYGDGPLKADIEKYIVENKLDKFVQCPGFTKDIIDKIKKASVYVSTSNYEGISNSMLEALALGIPSVITDCPVGGAKMTINNNENGILVPTGDVEAVYKGMKKIISDPIFAKKLRINSVKIKEEYSVNRILLRWLEIIDI